MKGKDDMSIQEEIHGMGLKARAAAGAMRAIHDRGLRIPDDVALIGFTDDVHAGYVTPRLSAIVDQSYEMGTETCKLLLKNINGDSHIYKKIVPQKLVIRETSAKK